eukprot:1158233-Pelagomonas_calceolata.AAC.3
MSHGITVYDMRASTCIQVQAIHIGWYSIQRHALKMMHCDKSDGGEDGGGEGDGDDDGYCRDHDDDDDDGDNDSVAHLLPHDVRKPSE